MSDPYYVVPLWYLLQLLANTCDALIWLFLLLRAALRRSYDHCFCGSAEIERREKSTLESCYALLSKKPRHMVLLIGTNATHVNEALLVRLLNYALQMDIACFSIYDTRRAQNGRLSIEKLKPPSDINLKVLGQRHYCWSTTTPKNGKISNGTGRCIEQVTNKLAENHSVTTNGTSHNVQKTLKIFEITEHDNLPLMVDVCRQLFKQRHTDEVQTLLKDRTQLMQRIDADLAQSLDESMFTEPELGLVFNADLCTFGMLPWHTRFTEFHAFKSGIGFDAAAFANVLYRYSRCEQRWGK